MLVLLFVYRESFEENWGSDKNGPGLKDEKAEYDGPAGMEPEGVIESNWDQVNIFAIIILCLKS